MSASILDPRMIDPSKPLQISQTNITSLTSTLITTPSGNSDTWNAVSTIVQGNSASWEESADITAVTTTVQSNSANWSFGYDVATYVQSNSASWEESAEVLPTVTNYLSTSNVQVSALSLSAVTFTNRFTVAIALTATTTVLEVLVNGTSKYLPLFDIN